MYIENTACIAPEIGESVHRVSYAIPPDHSQNIQTYKSLKACSKDRYHIYEKFLVKWHMEEIRTIIGWMVNSSFH